MVLKPTHGSHGCYINISIIAMILLTSRCCYDESINLKCLIDLVMIFFKFANTSRTQFDVHKIQLSSKSFSDAGDAELRKLQKSRQN